MCRVSIAFLKVQVEIRVLSLLKKIATLVASFWVIAASLALNCQVVWASPLQADPPVSQDNLATRSRNTALGQTVKELDKAIMRVHQAKDGSYWFGSDSQGAYRYDKKRIVRYSAEDGLAGNRIVGIQEDRTGAIYFTTNKGISKFDGQTFTTLPVAKHLGVFPNPWKLEPDDLWFPGEQDSGEVFRFDGKTLSRHLLPPTKIGQELAAKFPRDKFPNAIWNPNDVYRIYKDSKGRVWFGTAGAGLCRFDGKELKWMYESHLTDTPEGGSFGIRSILEDRNGDFWICNTRYRYRIDLARSDAAVSDGVNPSATNNDKVSYTRSLGVKPFAAPDGKDHIYFMDIVEDNSGKLWMVTYGFGVWCYDGVQMKHYPILDGTNQVKLFSMYKDRDGQLWLGTHESGTYKFDGQQFVRFQPDLDL